MGGVRFPLHAAVRSDEDDQPKPETPTQSVGVFDAGGYWVSLRSQGVFQLPLEALDFGTRIATLANQAYEQGRRDQAAEIREALDYGRTK